ncbi:MAG: DoxX family protein [Acidimicrobiia bacterium]
MTGEWMRRVFASRFTGPAAWIAATLRVVTGVLFISFSTGKFTDHMDEAVDFERYGLPWPDGAVYLAGALELLGGLLLVIGLLTRPAALVLAANLVVAIATAGPVDGGTFHLGVGPVMLVAMLFLVWAGPGVLALDNRIRDRVLPAG